MVLLSETPYRLLPRFHSSFIYPRTRLWFSTGLVWAFANFLLDKSLFPCFLRDKWHASMSNQPSNLLRDNRAYEPSDSLRKRQTHKLPLNQIWRICWIIHQSVSPMILKYLSFFLHRMRCRCHMLSTKMTCLLLCRPTEASDKLRCCLRGTI